MTVKQAIARLQGMPQDGEVMVLEVDGLAPADFYESSIDLTDAAELPESERREMPIVMVAATEEIEKE